MSKGKRVAIYARVSTTGQSVAAQLRELEAAAERHGWIVVQVFSDAGISGAKGRDKRPQFDKLLNGVARRDVRHGRGVERGPSLAIALGLGKRALRASRQGC